MSEILKREVRAYLHMHARMDTKKESPERAPIIIPTIALLKKNICAKFQIWLLVYFKKKLKWIYKQYV